MNSNIQIIGKRDSENTGLLRISDLILAPWKIAEREKKYLNTI